MGHEHEAQSVSVSPFSETTLRAQRRSQPTMSLLSRHFSTQNNKLDEEGHTSSTAHIARKNASANEGLDNNSLHSHSLHSPTKPKKGLKGSLHQRLGALSFKPKANHNDWHDSFGTAATTPLEEDDSESDASFCNFDDSLSSVEEADNEYDTTDDEFGWNDFESADFVTPEIQTSLPVNRAPGKADKPKLQFSHDDWNNFTLQPPF